uniref:Mevalonate kinase n=1 Tax=Thermofilum pendens TaxID=2269 RepID=A0A7C4BBI5_THEPE
MNRFLPPLYPTFVHEAKASAPGKVILFGEHFVVEGQPAIAVAVSLRARVTARPVDESRITVSSVNLGIQHDFDFESPDRSSPLYPITHATILTMEELSTRRGFQIRVDSSIPPAAGMGSSAAVAVATVKAVAAALGHDLERERVSRIAFEAERLVHGKPSGIDNTVATYGGAIAYRKGEGFLNLEVDFSPVSLVLADTGKPRRTGELVQKVLNLKAAFPQVIEPLYYAAGRLAVEAAKMMERGDFEAVGVLMNVNHGLLSAIGVSTAEVEQLVYAARQAGALGAKLTGAGGGGFIVALCRREDTGKVVSALERLSPRVFAVSVEKEGVRLEH